MLSKATVRIRNCDDEEEFSLPISMIDVVFLLLVFFLCAMQFRSMERKLDADLPREGPNPVRAELDFPTEIRVEICWANYKGQVIHGPSRPFPENWNGVIVPLETRGHHIVIKVNQLEIPQANLSELARTLADLGARNPNMPVVLDVRQAVPFKWVMGALDACARAEVNEVKFQSPPVERGGGSDWWWM